MTSVGPTPSISLFVLRCHMNTRGTFSTKVKSLIVHLVFVFFFVSFLPVKVPLMLQSLSVLSFSSRRPERIQARLVFKGRGERGLDVNARPHACSLAETGQSGRDWERAMQYMASGGSWIRTFPAHLEVHRAAGALCSWRGNTVTVKALKGTNFVNVIAFHRILALKV